MEAFKREEVQGWLKGSLRGINVCMAVNAVSLNANLAQLPRPKRESNADSRLQRRIFTTDSPPPFSIPPSLSGPDS